MQHADGSNDGHRQHPRQRRWRPSARVSILAVVAAAACAFVTLMLSASRDRRLRRDDAPTRHRHLAAAHGLSRFVDPRSVAPRAGQSLHSDPALAPRERCQIVYLLGVEGSSHHGLLPVLDALARHQIDPSSGRPFHVVSEPLALRAGLFGWHRGTVRNWGFSYETNVDDPRLVERVVRASCPNDGRHHVLLEWMSFPSGHPVDTRGGETFRVRRQEGWQFLTPEEIADSPEVQRHPTNLTAFVAAYAPYVDVKFVVLHRPFLATMASHTKWDGGVEGHSNVIRGFLLLLRRFLDAHRWDPVSGRRLWMLLCVDRLMVRHYPDNEGLDRARSDFVANLAHFLGWPKEECPHCFDSWRESRKDPLRVLGPRNVAMLTEHARTMEGVWPPSEDATAKQQCSA